MKNTVLDTSALLAMFFDEPGGEKVEHIFTQAVQANKPVQIAAVNWAEVIYKMEHKHGKPGGEKSRDFRRTMPIEVVAMDCELAEAAADLKLAHGLGLADAFAGALALQKKAELVTGDLEFKVMEKEIKIHWLK